MKCFFPNGSVFTLQTFWTKKRLSLLRFLCTSRYLWYPKLFALGTPCVFSLKTTIFLHTASSPDVLQMRPLQTSALLPTSISYTNILHTFGGKLTWDDILWQTESPGCLIAHCDTGFWRPTKHEISTADNESIVPK